MNTTFAAGYALGIVTVLAVRLIRRLDRWVAAELAEERRRWAGGER